MHHPRPLDPFLRALRRPLDALLGAEQRTFIPFLFVSALLAAIVWFVAVRPHKKTTLLGYLFPRAVWLHPSALLDYRLIVLRGLLSFVLVVPAFLSAIALAVALARSLRHTFGMTHNAVSGPWVAALFTVALFVADDLTRYLLHRTMHRVPVLWELHQVHHSAEVLTPFTLQRVHPLEGFAMAVRGSITLGLVTGVFIWLFPGQVRASLVLGVDVISFAFAALGANLRHSNVWLSYGPVLERIFISPAQHQFHHSGDPEHYDRNYGAALAIWDWMFGSLLLAGRYRRLRFGLPAGVRNHSNTLGSVVVDPLRAIVRRGAPRRGVTADGATGR